MPDPNHRRDRIGAVAEKSIVVAVVASVGLFVTALRLPVWLVIDSLTDLKGKIIDVIQLVVAIKFLEKLVKADDPLDTLWYALAVSAVILALLAVRWVQKNDSH